ncbi:MAG: hypothetical protein DRH06_00010 [Deltaproteobacteria bacterium]|nr:MAG: hypothetical protein DRH06_00010 [Deltaproteobacteria bacterium]
MIPAHLCTENALVHYAGDSWSGLTIKYSFTGDPVDTPPGLRSARMQLRTLGDVLVYEFNTEIKSIDGLPEGYPYNTKGAMNIVADPSYVWILGIDSQPVPVPPGAYIWDLETINNLGVKNTLLTGKITICADITR